MRSRRRKHRRAGARASRFWEWIRHHTAAVISTIVDYSVMVATRRARAPRSRSPATPIAAFAGAVTNFTLEPPLHLPRGRQPGRAARLWRYVLVSACSLGLNTLGEYLFLDGARTCSTCVARVITSIIVSNVWNYPMHAILRILANAGPSRA